MQQPSSVKTRKASRVPLEHAEEQSSRARTSDGRPKASRCVRTFVSFAGRETSVVSSAGCRVGALSILLRTQSVTKRCSRQCRVGALLLLNGAKNSSTRCSRPVPTMEAIRKDGESRHPHGSLSRPPVAIRTSGTGATANLPVVLLGGESHPGPAAIHRRGSGPCACTACRRQRGTDLSNWVVLTIVS